MRYNPIDYGAAGDGRTDDTTAFRHLFAVVGRAPATLVLANVFAVNGLAVPANFSLSFEDGGLARAPGGAPASIAGPISARLEQILAPPVRFVRERPRLSGWWGRKRRHAEHRPHCAGGKRELTPAAMEGSLLRRDRHLDRLVAPCVLGPAIKSTPHSPAMRSNLRLAQPSRIANSRSEIIFPRNSSYARHRPHF